MTSPALTVINITPLSVLINSLIIALAIYIPYNIVQNIKYGNIARPYPGLRGGLTR
ncbi:hypothetical protein [Vulcanisaeta distributa]|uniref:hypothetical protein n=1 Tax=Vulcanisaeta distributa TaxID=164451 RepID=UPI000A96149E|nr:hypothetical protein [Vulcanisaeta distributa]